MFLHTVPINIAHFDKAFPQLERLWEGAAHAHPNADLNYVKGAMMIHVRATGVAPAPSAITRWLKTGRSAQAHSAWVTIRTILELNGYKVAYPNRLGGKYSSKEYHPFYRYPWAFSLDVDDHQINWLRQNGWIVTKE